jgi:hypothetical protein
MNNFIKDLVFGMLSAYVPLNMMSSQFGVNSTKNGFSYTNAIRFFPILYGVINAGLMPLMRHLRINNYFIIGFIFAIVYSSFGRFMAEIPQRVFEMEDVNRFHLQSVVTWGLFYGIVGYFYYNYLCSPNCINVTMVRGFRR